MGREPVKRWTVGLLTLVILCFVAACSSQESGDISMPETYFSEAITETESADGTDGQQVSEHHKILIAYFTWADNVENTSEVVPPHQPACKPQEMLHRWQHGFSMRLEGNYSPSG